MNKPDIWERARELEDEITALISNFTDVCTKAIDDRDKRICRLEDELADAQDKLGATLDIMARVDREKEVRRPHWENDADCDERRLRDAEASGD
jgi:hypothetical protein